MQAVLVPKQAPHRGTGPLRVLSWGPAYRRALARSGDPGGCHSDGPPCALYSLDLWQPVSYSISSGAGPEVRDQRPQTTRSTSRKPARCKNE